MINLEISLGISILILTLIIGEIIFWFIDTDKPKKGENILLFTAETKIFSLMMSFIVSVFLISFIVLLIKYWRMFLFGIVGIGIIVLYFWLNSLKFRRKTK